MLGPEVSRARLGLHHLSFALCGTSTIPIRVHAVTYSGQVWPSCCGRVPYPKWGRSSSPSSVAWCPVLSNAISALLRRTNCEFGGTLGLTAGISINMSSRLRAVIPSPRSFSSSSTVLRTMAPFSVCSPYVCQSDPKLTHLTATCTLLGQGWSHLLW